MACTGLSAAGITPLPAAAAAPPLLPALPLAAPPLPAALPLAAAPPPLALPLAPAPLAGAGAAGLPDVPTALAGAPPPADGALAAAPLGLLGAGALPVAGAQAAPSVTAATTSANHPARRRARPRCSAGIPTPPCVTRPAPSVEPDGGRARSLAPPPRAVKHPAATGVTAFRYTDRR